MKRYQPSVSPALPPALSRRNFLFISAGSTVAFVTGCGGGKGVGDSTQEEGVGGFSGGDYGGEALTLAYWNGFTGGDGPAMQALVKEFQSAQKNITIKNNTVEWADFYQQLPAAVQASKGPDVGVMHLDQISTNAARSVIVPLDDLAESLGLEEGDFAPSVWEPGIYDGKRYGIPLDVHSLAMYFNQDHFEKAGISAPPTDAVSLDEACAKLKESGIATPFWMPNLWPAHLMFFSLLWQFGGGPYAEDGSEATFGSEAGVQALTWMREQVEKGYSPDNVNIDSQYVAFKNGENSITWDGIWQINDLEASGLNYGVAPIPTVGDEPAVWANSHNFFLTSQASEEQDRADAAKTFIGWMSEQSAAWSQAGMIPARNSAREESAYTDSVQFALKDQTEHLHFLPGVPGIGDVTPQTVEIAVNEAVLGRKSPQEALSQAQDDANQLLEENSEKFGL
ncbi:MAG: ABC transporter substrate-binding protein [Nocardioidaceae bacterium]|nr:ABC transporter substrate-binding protein [Nocardioidaceae bacterium]